MVTPNPQHNTSPNPAPSILKPGTEDPRAKSLEGNGKSPPAPETLIHKFIVGALKLLIVIIVVAVLSVAVMFLVEPYSLRMGFFHFLDKTFNIGPMLVAVAPDRFPTETPTASPTLTPSPQPTATPVLAISHFDAQWRGPEDYCYIPTDQFPPPEYADYTLEDWYEYDGVDILADLANEGIVLRVGRASSRPPAELDPVDYFFPSSDAVFSFDLAVNHRVKVSNIYVSVLDYQPLPVILYCESVAPEMEAHTFIALINKSTNTSMNRFPAYLVSKTGEPGFIWLEDKQSESFFILFNAQTQGLYTVECCVIEISEGATTTQYQIDSGQQHIIFTENG